MAILKRTGLISGGQKAFFYSKQKIQFRIRLHFRLHVCVRGGDGGDNVHRICGLLHRVQDYGRDRHHHHRDHGGDVRVRRDHHRRHHHVHVREHHVLQVLLPSLQKHKLFQNQNGLFR